MKSRLPIRWAAFNYPQMSIMCMYTQIFFVTCNKNENHTL